MAKAVIAGIGIVIGATVGWVRMEAKVDAKADRADLQRVESSVQTLNREVLSELRALKAQNEQVTRFICRQSPSAFGC